MILFLLILVYTITCVFVVLTVLLQSGKGGGLSSLGSGAGGALSDSLGATGAEKTLVKATSWGSGVFLALSIILTLYGSYIERSAGLSIGAGPAAPTAPAGTAPATTSPASTTAPATTAPATTAPATTAPATTAPAAAKTAATSPAPSAPAAPAAPPAAAPAPEGQPAQPEAS